MIFGRKYLVMLAGVWVPCFALAGASVLWVLDPQTRRSHDLKAKLEETKQVYAAAQEAIKPRDQERLALTAEQWGQRVLDFVAPSEGGPDLAFEIGQIASQAGIESFSMRPKNKQGLDPVPECERIGQTQIDVSFTASFSRFASFLNALERHRPIMLVETFTIIRPQMPSTEPQVNLQLVVLGQRPEGGRL